MPPFGVFFAIFDFVIRFRNMFSACVVMCVSFYSSVLACCLFRVPCVVCVTCVWTSLGELRGGRPLPRPLSIRVWLRRAHKLRSESA